MDLITILWENVSKRSENKKRKYRSVGTASNKNSDRPNLKCFRCGSEYHIIAKFPKPPKDSEKRRKSDKSKEKVTRAKDNSDDDNELNILR